MTDTQAIIIYGWLISVPCIMLLGGICGAIFPKLKLDDDDFECKVMAFAIFWPPLLIVLGVSGLSGLLLWGPSAIRDLFKRGR